MIDLPFPIDQWSRPIVIIIFITLLGLAFKIFIHSRLRRAAALSKWEGDDVISFRRHHNQVDAYNWASNYVLEAEKVMDKKLEELKDKYQLYYGRSN